MIARLLLPLFLILAPAARPAALDAEAPPTPIAAELRVRDTSFFAGNTFHFYIRIKGIDQADPPRLHPTDASLQIRYVGAAASSSHEELAYTFTYEAMPLRAGPVTIPASELLVKGQPLTTPPRTLEVSAPLPADSMLLNVRLSHQDCFVGEPVTLSVSWVCALSLNGIKALDLRIPLATDPHFQLKPPLRTPDANDPRAIGLPVANQRIIALYSETTLNGQPAIELRFDQVLLPVLPSSLHLLLPPATLLCSYTEPTKTKFQGTRYPSHFNNDFFDQDVTGSYQRYFVQAPPVTLRIKPLPANQPPPASFSGIVGSFSLSTSAEPLVTAALSPVSLKLKVSGYSFPQLLELPPWKQQSALDRAFLLPQDLSPVRGTLQEDGSLDFSVPIRPRSEAITAIPSLELSYFDPRKESYETVRTREIPLTVTPATPATVYDLEFADGSKLRNEVEPEPPGLTHNAAGAGLLETRMPHTWTLQPWVWLLAFGLPPLFYLLLRLLSRDYRKSRAHPEAARREFAFRRFRKALRHLPPGAPPFAVSQLLRSYFSDRFDLPSLAGESPDLASVARQAGVAPETAETLGRLIALTDLHTFGHHGTEPAPLEKHRLIQLVRQFETKAAPRAVWLGILGFAMSSWGAVSPSPATTLAEANAFFDRANEAALVNPEQAQGLYRLAASRFESLITQHSIRNGELYFNLGNTHFLAGDLGRAIVNYLRAQEYLPTDARLADALRAARLRQVDVFPRAAPSRLMKAALFWHYQLGPRERFLLIAAAYSGIWGILGLHLFLPLEWRWKAWTALAAIILLAGSSSLLHARADPQRAAVVVHPEVLPRKGDAQIYDPAFTNPLHSGAEITILEQRRDWLRIRVEDGSQGWIPASAAERVLP